MTDPAAAPAVKSPGGIGRLPIVSTDDFTDAALVLIGHGSTVNAESSQPTHLHAATLRRRGRFAQVLTAFWKEEPAISGVLRGAFTRRVFIVPFFISEGYFTDEVIPRELGLRGPDGAGPVERFLEREGQRLHYCAPVGTHPAMTGLILSRAREVVREHPGPGAPAPGDTTLFIAGHGTGRNVNSRRAIDHQVDLIRGTGGYAAVHAVFMEEAPLIRDCQALASTRALVVVPFFISDGLHSREDIPVLLGESPEAVGERMKAGRPTWVNPTESRGRLVWYARGVGSDPHMVDVILERVREAARPDPDRIHAPV